MIVEGYTHRLSVARSCAGRLACNGRKRETDNWRRTQVLPRNYPFLPRVYVWCVGTGSAMPFCLYLIYLGCLPM